MELSEYGYSASKKRSIIYIFVYVIFFAILFYYHQDIINALNLPVIYNSVFSLLLGLFFADLTYSHFRSFFKPKIRICQHFFIYSYDQTVIPWNQITHMRVTTEGWLVITVSSEEKSHTHRVNVGSVSNKKKFLCDIEKICEIKEIPFEKPEGHIRFF
ncbi:MAG: hypothetical protein PVF58_16470 [Candidatus Methanofastidiosia archaeon]|jgi:hypothetical protein